MATPRKKKEARQDPVSKENDPVLAEACDGPDGSDAPYTWETKAQTKAKEANESWLRGWFKVKNPKLSATEIKDMIAFTIAHWKKK